MHVRPALLLHDIARYACRFFLEYVVLGRGADVPVLCRAIGYDAALTAHPDARVPIATIQRLWPLVLVATHDPYFGLHLGRWLNFTTAGTLAYVLLHTPTLGAAIIQLCRY